MPLPMPVTNLLKDMDGYIDQSAKDASIYFIKHGIAPEIFEGLKMDLSAETCKMVYKEMIIEILLSGSQVSFKYGLMVTMLPKHIKNKVIYMIHLGMSFPDRHKKCPGIAFSLDK